MIIICLFIFFEFLKKEIIFIYLINNYNLLFKKKININNNNYDNDKNILRKVFLNKLAFIITIKFM